MSSYELVLVFYNVLNPVGAKLKTLVERYEFLENMEVGLLCIRRTKYRLSTNVRLAIRTCRPIDGASAINCCYPALISF